ncbi:hypothetical protein KR044_006935, partial [Drosophila immigrans]
TLVTKNTSPSYGGVALLIHNSIQTRDIAPNDDFDAICAEVTSKLKFKIISVYLAPNQKFSRQNLQNVLQTSSTPTIVI